MPYMLKDNIRIYYEYEPANNLIDSTETLVLIHGVGFDLRGWDLIVPYMTNDYNVLRYDFRGHGLSDRGAEKLNDKTFVDDLIHLLTHMHIDKFHFLAHGAGSVLALFYTNRHPSRVQSSVFVSLPLFNSSDTAHKYASYRKDLNIHNSIQAIADHVIPNVTLYPNTSSEMIKLYEAFSKVTIDVYFEILEFYISVHEEIVGIFKENVIPTLLLTGEQDNMFPTFLSSLTASSNPNCRYMTIYNASNMVFYDQPAETFKQINHFFNHKMEQRIPVDPLLKDLHSNFLDMLNEPQIKNNPIRLEVNLINQFQVFVDNVQIIRGWGRRNAKELLTYLLFHPNVTRDQICEELWGEIDNTKAKNHLRVCLSHLTQLLNNKETKILFIEKKQISLSDEVQCDLLILLQKIKKAIEEKNNKIKEEIISELFLNVDQSIFRNLNEDWNMHIRIKIEIQLIELANTMSELLIAQGKLTDAISYLKFVLIFNPEDYSTYKQISHLYERNHQNAEAQKWREEAERLKLTF